MSILLPKSASILRKTEKSASLTRTPARSSSDLGGTDRGLSSPGFTLSIHGNSGKLNSNPVCHTIISGFAVGSTRVDVQLVCIFRERQTWTKLGLEVTGVQLGNSPVQKSRSVVLVGADHFGATGLGVWGGHGQRFVMIHGSPEVTIISRCMLSTLVLTVELRCRRIWKIFFWMVGGDSAAMFVSSLLWRRTRLAGQLRTNVMSCSPDPVST
jgi:hypothetical protein